MADEVVALVHSLCIDCVANLDILSALVMAPEVQSTVETCAGCRRATRVTYRFSIDRIALTA